MRRAIDNVNQIASADVLELVHEVMHLYRARQFRALRDAGHGVTHMEARALGFFARHAGATQAELAGHSGRDKGQVARLVQGLRERGLLDTRPDEADRRAVRLYLTAEGQAVFDGLRQQSRRLAKVAVRGFAAAEREQLHGLLARVRANLDGEEEG